MCGEQNFPTRMAKVIDLSMNEKMCGFGSNGASAMIGRRNGAAAKLKEKVPWLVNNHCVAHMLQSWTE